MFRSIRRCFARASAAFFLFFATQMGLAHDIPGKVTILVYAKPTDSRLQVLARIPMEVMTESTFPVKGPGYLDFSKADRALREAAQVYLGSAFHFYADGQELPTPVITKVRVALPSDKSFTEFATALQLVNSPPLNDDEQLYFKQGLLDVLLEYPISNANAKFALDPSLERIAMETHTVLRFIPPSGSERIFDYTGYPGRIELEPGFWHATSRFVVLGFFHILDGIDHLLFLLCLAIPSRSVRSLVPAITAFTVAHSITLISSALSLVPTATWFTPLIETLIAGSVFYMACENMFGAHLRARWLVVFAFGLIHGFGFSFILSDRMQFAGNHLVSSLLAFNVGVELGQLVVLIVAVPALNLFFRYFKREQLGIVVLSVIAAHTAWHWLIERGEELLRFAWQLPAFDATFFAALIRWVMLLMAAGAVMWILSEVFGRFASKFESANRSAAAK